MNLPYQKYISNRLLQTAPFWGAAILISVIAVVYANIFKVAEQFSQDLAAHHPLYLLILTPTCFLLSWGLVKLAPEAKGSGLPQVMLAVTANRQHRYKLLKRLISFPTAMIKVLSSIICVIGGGAVGREGPTAQVGASVFYGIGTRLHRLGFKRISTEVWIVAGSAAGISAAFNTPLGGIVFAIEELSQSSFHRLKLMLIGAVILAGLTAQWLSGPYLYLGYPTLDAGSISSVGWVILASILCGGLGAIFAKILYALVSVTSKIKKPYFPFFVVFLGLCIALTGIFVGPYAIGAGREVLMGLLFKDVSLDWTVTVARFFTPIMTYISGVSGGVFAPSLSAGGCIGYLFAKLLQIHNVHLFVMLGMISFLTGVTRAPFTSFVLVLEMTGQHQVIFPMMIAAVVSSICAKLIDPRSFYSKVKRDYMVAG